MSNAAQQRDEAIAAFFEGLTELIMLCRPLAEAAVKEATDIAEAKAERQEQANAVAKRAVRRVSA